MGRAKPVTIDGMPFSTKGKAQAYFMDERDRIKQNGPVTEGDFFEKLKDLYTRYCEYSPGYELNGREIKEFFVDYEPRENQDNWGSYLCYWVRFTNDEKLPFSVPNAITVIINNES